MTALMEASANGHTGIVMELLRNGAEVNAVCRFDWDAVLKALEERDVKAYKALMDNGAGIDPQSNTGLTALMRAAGGRHPAVVRVLLANGADVNARDRDGTTALMKAAREGYAEPKGVVDPGRTFDLTMGY